MTNKRSYYLGLGGSVIGLMFIIIAVSPLGKLMDLNIHSPVLIISAMICSFIGFFGCFLLKRGKDITAGFLMLFSAIGGMISVSVYYIFPGFLLVLAGLISILKKTIWSDE